MFKHTWCVFSVRRRRRRNSRRQIIIIIRRTVTEWRIIIHVAANGSVCKHSGHGLFGRPMAVAAAKTMPGHRWWTAFGSGTPELQLVATRVLAQTVSASACERNGPHLTLFTLKRGIDYQATRYIIIIVPLVGLSLLALVAYLLQYSFVAFCFCFIKRV